MRFRRPALGLVTLFLLLPAFAHATTAADLSPRMHLDGSAGDFAADEWILDASSPFPEAVADSRWGSDNDIARVALTWDAARLYLAVQFTARDSAAMVMIGNGPGGLVSLDQTGEFRRAIDPPFGVNLLLLASRYDTPRAALSDASHAFAWVDDAALPVRVATREDTTVCEAWIPWTLLDPSRPLRITVVTTGGTGSGAGDAAPDARTVLSDDRYARAVIDRWFAMTPDSDRNGTADAGVAPRSAGAVEPDTAPSLAAGADGIEVTVWRTVFAPDRGEDAQFTVHAGAEPFDDVSGRCEIRAMDGRRVRTLAIPAASGVDDVTVRWDGRDDSGRICDGGVYVAAFEVDYSAGGVREHARKRVGVALAR